MKLSQITSPGFAASLNKLSKGDLPILTAYSLKTAIGVLETEQAKFESLRKELVEKYAEKNEDGTIKKNERGEYRVAQESVGDFMKEIEELMKVEVQVPTIKLSALGTKLTLSADDLMNLEGLIVE